MSRHKSGFPRELGSRFARRFAASATIGACLLVSAPAMAATLAGPISGWQKGTEPSWTSMYEYVPANLAPNAPILVHVHYCSGNAQGAFTEATGGQVVAAADKYGFLMILPQTSQNCWDVATKASLTHGGGGDTGAIVDMVNYAISKHGSNANRVYVSGTSSGAMMVQGLLAVYPDVFKAGAEFAGVPAGCWSVNDPNGQWSSPCAGGQVTHTAADWGTMVRAMYPGYSGYRPRIQLWHGEADTAISFTNQTESIKEWTNIFGLTTTPTSAMDTTIYNHQYSHQQWKNSCGYTVIDAYSEVQGPHGTDADMSATYVIPFLTLDKPGATDPQVAMCGTGAGADGGAPGGSGGSANGTGGSNVGSTGAGGSSSGTGGAMNVGTAGDVGNEPTSGGSGGDTGTGSQDITTGMDTPEAAAASRPGCSCDLADASGARDGLLWAIVALNAAFVRRRRASSSAHGR